MRCCLAAVLALVASCDAVFGLRSVDGRDGSGSGVTDAASSHRYVQSASALSNSAGGTTMLVVHLHDPPRVGDLLVVTVAAFGTTVPSPFDSGGNPYTTVVSPVALPDDQGASLEMFAATQVTTNSNFNITLIPDDSTTGFVTMSVLEYATSGSFVTAATGSGSDNAPSCGGVSTETPELAVAAMNIEASGGVQPGAGFTQREEPNTDNGSDPVLATADAPADATTTTATFTAETAGSWACGLAIFQ